MNTVILSLGTNLGDRSLNMCNMITKCKKFLYPPYIRSEIYETEPVDVFDEQPKYLNAIIAGIYKKQPDDLLKDCQQAEKSMGREGKWERLARVADIDIILFGHLIVNRPYLKIPHPAIYQRRYLIHILSELFPEKKDPFVGNTFKILYEKCDELVLNQTIYQYLP